MRMKRILGLVGVAVVVAAAISWVGVSVQERFERVAQAEQTSGNGGGGPPNAPYQKAYEFDVPYVPTAQPVVEKMLQMAAVTKDDVVYDLGCGDGRIVITAAKVHGARGIGVDIDPVRIKESKANALEAAVTDRVKFVQRDLFKMDLKEATVVTLYLLPEINLKLRPKLFRELRPGTRIVSHDFDMGEWQPKETVKVRDQREHTIYYWTIPEKKDWPAFAREEAKGTS
jgi:SAM-dependent methyltransferase